MYYYSNKKIIKSGQLLSIVSTIIVLYMFTNIQKQTFCLASTSTSTLDSSSTQIKPIISSTPNSNVSSSTSISTTTKIQQFNVQAEGQSMRQGRSQQQQQPTLNSIETSSKYRFEQDRKQLMELVTPKNIVKSLIKLLWGNQDETIATSRQLLTALAKVLEMLKGTFGQKARSSNGSGLRETIDDVAGAGVSMLHGYVKAMIAPEDKCVQRYLCQASKDAVVSNRYVGSLVSQVAGYASSYLLESQKYVPFAVNYEATRRGRNLEDCAKLYRECNEEHL